MNKVNQLPEKTNLTKLKVKLPPAVLEAYKNYCGGEEEMWVVGDLMGDFFLSPLPPDTKGERRLYPMPPEVVPADILEWEVVENLNQ